MPPPSAKAPASPLVAAIRAAMIEKKITQAELADAADCHEKTVQNLLAGRHVRDQTLFDVCMVLGLDFDRVKGANGGIIAPVAASTPDQAGRGGDVAPIYMGAYTRAGVDHYIGSYLTIRPAFSRPDLLIAYRTDISWDSSWPSLLFEERDRPDAPYAHRGRLYIPASSMFIHLVSLTKGAMRMVLVSQVDRAGEMRGLVTTLNKQGAQFVPVSAPIVYKRQDAFVQADLGEIASAHKKAATYQALLQETVATGYARLVTPGR